MDVKRTTIKIIDRNSAHFGECLPVAVTYADKIYLDVGDGQSLAITRSQCEVVHIQDYDQFIDIDGDMNYQAMIAIQSFLQSLEDFVLWSGWNGRNGHFCAKFTLGTASKNLESVQACCAKHGLVATKAELIF